MLISLLSHLRRLIANAMTYPSPHNSQREERSNLKEQRVLLVLESLFILGLALYTLRFLTPSLFLPWFFTSDEVVYAAEVIRFLGLDFRQVFFDIPGTPLMFLTAGFWSLGYWVLVALGHIDPLGIRLFTFQHLDALYFLMRSLVLLFYAGSVVLTYLIGKRLTNSAGGCVAALLLAFFEPYTTYNTFVRTESMGICLALGALCLALNAIESSKIKPYFLAGITAGVAMAARFPFALATLPVILLLYFLLKKPSKTKEIPWWSLILSSLIGLCFVTGAIIVILLKLDFIQRGTLTDVMLISSIDTSVPNALAIVQTLWLLLATLILAILIAFCIPLFRNWAKSLVEPPVVLLLTGFGVGLLLGTPTILWSGRYLLRSIEFYRGWVDYPRLALSRWGQFIDVFSFYWKVAAPTTAIGFLLIIGAMLVLVRKDRYMWPILAGGMLAFLAQPLKMKVWPHHILPWLPYLSILVAYPFAIVYQMFGQVRGSKGIGQALILSTAILLGVTIVQNGPKNTFEKNVTLNVPRLEAVAEASKWLEENTESDAEIFIAYHAFNEHVFYRWMELQQVPVPDVVKGTRTYYVWWLDRPPLMNHAGYVVATHQDVDGFKQEWDYQTPGKGVDPYTEQTFTPLKSFGVEPFIITVFHFDFEKPPSGN